MTLAPSLGESEERRLKMRIEISDTVLSGNLGDGWADENEAADAYAEHLETFYRDAAIEWFGPEAKIYVTVEARHNTSGATAGVSAFVYADDGEIHEKSGPFEYYLSQEEKNEWPQWCDSEEAEALLEE